RGTTPTNLTLLAQVDKTGTEFVDALCVTDPTHPTGTPCTAVARVPLDGTPLIQNRTVGTVASGTLVVLRADTALAADIRAGTAMPLRNTGLTYVFSDSTARNGFPYFYKVTAFDINSIMS